MVHDWIRQKAAEQVSALGEAYPWNCRPAAVFPEKPDYAVETVPKIDLPVAEIFYDGGHPNAHEVLGARGPSQLLLFQRERAHAQRTAEDYRNKEERQSHHGVQQAE